MALASKDIPVTREMVFGWLQSYKPGVDAPIRDYLAEKLSTVGQADTEVDTAAHESLGDVTPLLDMILDDLPSYGYNV